MTVSLLCQSALAESWREMRKRIGANFYDILASHRAEEALQTPNPGRQANAELFEELEEGDFQFERWRNFVEARVQPSGDLSLLSRTGQETRKWMGLDGAPIPANAGNWTFIGPTGNPAGNSFTGIPNGNGRLNFIRFHPTDANFFLAGSPGGGLWISRNAGTSWSPTTDAIASLGVADAAVDPVNPNILYIATGDRDGGDTRSIGVLKSLDGGKTWNTTGLTWSVNDNKEGGRILVNPANPALVLHAGSDGVYRSTDGGATFARATGVTSLIRAMEFKPGDPNVVYAAGASVYYSADGGQSWTAATGPSTLAASRVVLAVSPAAPDKVWAYTSASNLLVSANSGRTYTFVGVGADVGQSTYNLAAAVSHTDPDYIVTGQVQMKRSQDGGQTWTAFQTGSHWDIHGLEFQTGTNTLFAANDGGVYRSVNGANWTTMNSGLQVSQMYRIGVSKANPNNICNGYQDNGTTLLLETGNTRIGPADGFECFFDPDNPNTMYTEIYNGAHSRCTWNGTSASCTGITSGLSGSGQWNTAWSLDPNSSSTLFTTRGGAMFKSVNRGTAWTALGAMGGTGSIVEFKVAPSNSDVLYAAKGSAVYRTADGGSTWTSRSTGLSGTLTSITVDGLNPDKVWVSISGYTAGRKVYRSNDGGQSWISYSEGLPNLPANTIVSEGGTLNGVYVGMDAGVYYRNDNMTTWQPFFDGLPNAAVMELEIGGTGTAARLKAATYGRGAWQSQLWGLATPIARDAATAPHLTDFKAEVRNGSGWLDLQFHLSGQAAKAVTVLVTTVSGRIVHRENARAAGFFSRRIDLSQYGKGTYLLRVAGTSISKPFIVL